jgi:CDP-glucose 4,6-dehydratase
MFGNIYKNKRILVTGNTGFKGSWLTNWLLKLGAEVHGVANDIPSSPAMFEILKLKDKIHHYELDIRNYKSFLNLITKVKPHFVFHLAAQAIVARSYSNPLETITTNVIGTTNVLEALHAVGNECNAVIITSDKCYHNNEWSWGYRENDRLGGGDIYSASKAAAEQIIHGYFNSFFKSKSAIRIASARAGNVIGGGDWAEQRLVPDCIRSWAKGDRVSIRAPSSTRPWQHVLEPLSGYLRLGQILEKNSDISGESFNFGPSPELSISVEEVLSNLAIRWGWSELEEACFISKYSQFKEAGLLHLNCDKALSHLQWLPVLQFEQMIKYTVDWYKKYYNDGQDDMQDYSDALIEQYEDLAIKKNLQWAK